MKKKLVAFMLTLMMILSSSVFFSEVIFAEGEKTFVLKKADGTKLGEYDEISNGNSDTLIGMMNSTGSNESYIIEVTKKYEFKGETRQVFKNLNITFTSKKGTTAILTAGDNMPHFMLMNGNYTFKNIILEGKAGFNGGGIYTHDDNTGITITLDSGTVVRNCKYVDAPYYFRPIVIRDKYNDGNDSTLIINDGVLIENEVTNSSDAGCAVSVRDNCKLIVNGGTFKNNFSQNPRFGGGAILNDKNAETIINGGIFEGNKSSGFGGAILNYGKLTINVGTFKGNEALNGGAIYSLGDLTINGGIFENNKATNKWGGAIVANNKVQIKNATFENNFSNLGGAAYLFSAPNASVENSNFINNGQYNKNIANSGGALFVNGIKNISIKGNTFSKNTSRDGGALFVSDTDGKIEQNKFYENFAERFSSAFHLRQSNAYVTDNIYKNNGKRNDTATLFAALMIESVKSGKTLTIENEKFENNAASKSGGAIVIGEGKVNLKNCEFINNKVTEYGGALYIADDGFANIENSKFIGNSAKRGGAIVTELFSSENPAQTGKYKNLKLTNDVIFSDNFASDGYFNPPSNYKDFPDLKFKSTSLMGKLRVVQKDLKTYNKVDSLLNNYDILYVNPLITVIYDSNGGTPEEKIYGTELKSENNEIFPAVHKVNSLYETGLKKAGYTFKGWNDKADGAGKTFEVGKEYKLSSNLHLYAQWNEAKTTPTTITLSIDENYTDGKITNFNILPGDSAERYLYFPKRNGYSFIGWSYSRDYFEEVNPEDKINKSTTLYAFWNKEYDDNQSTNPNAFWDKEYDGSRERLLNETKTQKHIAYIFGYPDETVRPDGNITRAEAATMIARLLDIEHTGSIDKPNFLDTPSLWYNKAINAVVRRGIMKGYPDGTFKPNSHITRAEFTQMISMIDDKSYGTAPFSDIVGHWAEKSIGKEYKAGRIAGYPDGTFRPNANITRCEATVILNKMFKRNYDAMSLSKCKNPNAIKRFIDLNKDFWGYRYIIEATNAHDFIRRDADKLPEDWIQIR